MPFVQVGSTVIPIAQSGGAAIDVDEVGGRERMLDASMVERVQARKQTIALVSKPVARATAETYKTALLATPPIACTGDLFNNVSTNCFVKYQGMTALATASSVLWHVRFTLYEA